MFRLMGSISFCIKLVCTVGSRTQARCTREPRSSGTRFPISFGFGARRLRPPRALAIEAIDSPPLALLRISSISSTPIIPLRPSSRRKPRQRHCRANCGWSACPCSKPKEFRAQARNFPTLKPATSRLSNTGDRERALWKRRSCRYGNGGRGDT